MNIKTLLIVLMILLAIGIATYGFLRPIPGETSSASVAAQTVSGDEEAMHRITETAFRMSPPAATLCKIDATESPPHVGYYCHVFANSVALETIKSGRGEYPLGSIVVKQKYASRLIQNTELFTIMRKMKEGYDDENGNWEYSIVDSTGSNIQLRGREASCIQCHAYYKETDFVSRVYLQD
ncbi:cytochrome P460 family protein [Mariniblastus sp.]|nr:cytochrome P460 family protein [Mariniblastus sp.]